MAKRFLTMDIGAATVSLAEYEAGAKGSLKLLRYGTAQLAAPLDAGDAATILAPALLEIVREKGIRPGPVAISVSGQMVFPRFASIAAAGGDEKFEQQVRFEIEQNIPFPIDEMVCDRQVLGETETGEKAVMIVATKLDQVEDITSAVVSVGFRPEIVDVAPIALTNGIRYAHPEEAEGCVVILDIGAKTTSLVIAEGDRLYNRSIPIAGNAITKDIAQALGCETEEAERFKLENAYVSLGGVSEDEDERVDRVSKVCRAVLSRLHAEISRSVNFYRSQQGGSAPTKLYLSGGTALLPQLDQFFAESLQIDVAYFNPFDVIGVGPAVDLDALAYDGAVLAPTVGLALHATDAARFAINLLPPSIVEERAEKKRVPVVALAGVALVAALVLGLLAVNREAEAVKASSEAVETRVARLKGFEAKVKKAAADVESAQREADALKALLARRGAAVARLAAVRDSLAGGMWIEKWENGRFTVRGWKDRLDALVAATAAKDGGKRKTASELVVEKLRKNAAVVSDSVKISDMTTIGRTPYVDQFTVELKFK